ncbi:MAG: PorT family protein [Flavobacteriaceae bacterium]|jgi:hypothetical protein|nr:PorT family protein [Flavobacteriaceae bacterium]
MKQFILLLIGSMFFMPLYAQEEVDAQLKGDSLLDLNYREDQFYFGISHNIMQDKLKGYSPNSVSLGVDLGFLRDFPINKSRTVAIAPGVGYSYSNLNNNLGLSEDGKHMVMKDFKHSALSLHMIDLPLELRWRTSTFDSHKFWRIYVGVKASYIFSDKLKTTANSYTVELKNDELLNKWIYGTYISVGFNTWNFYTYYGLNDLYKHNPIANDPSKLRLLKVGLIFYIL